MTPFDLFKQDADEVIAIINYFIEKGKDSPHAVNTGAETRVERVRVNDKTATGGWW